MKNQKDVFLPKYCFYIGICLIILGIFSTIGVFTIDIAIIYGSIFLFSIGICAILCEKNQWIKMIDDNSFIYSTMFGRKKEYHFQDLISIGMNRGGSITLYFENGKVHIEDIARISDRFSKTLDNALKQIT